MGNYNNNVLDTVVPQGVDDTVTSYFEQVTGNKESARMIAGAVINTAKAQNMDPMEVLDNFRKMPKGQLNDFLVLFLNYNRYGSSLLGLSNQPMPNKYVTRTILV